MNPYTLWFGPANQNLTTYNKLAFRYNLIRLKKPLNIK